MDDYSEQQQSSSYSSESDKQQIASKKKHKATSIAMIGSTQVPPINSNIIINLALTHYDVIQDVAEQLGWKITRKLKPNSVWDVLWTDHHIPPEFLIKLQLYQKVSHFPGIHVLSRKNLLGISFMDMYKRVPEHYNFFPKTWLLPSQYSDLRKEFVNQEKTFIVKPQADCQGRGIFLTQKIEEVGNGGHYVVQQYISKPFLVDGLKFDFRVYVLLCGVSPLRLYIYEEGLARFATQPYIEPNKVNLKKQYMHLTNYAINKKNPKFVFNSSSQRMDVGHKRALTSVLKLIEKKGFNMAKLKQEINAAIVKTLLLGHPLAAHQYRFCQPHDEQRNICFHILGIDIMLDSQCKPYVLEVNHTPSFVADTPLDRFIKFSLIKDTLELMNITPETRAKAVDKMNKLQRQKALMKQKRQLYQNLDRQEKVRIAQEERTTYENQNMGRYSRIFPVDDSQKMQLYEQLLQVAEKAYFSQNNVLRAQMEKEKAYEEANFKQKQRDEEKEEKIKKVALQQLQSTLYSPKLKKNISANDNTLRQTQIEYEGKLSPIKRARINSLVQNHKKTTLVIEMKELQKLKQIQKELSPMKLDNKPGGNLSKKSSSIATKSKNLKLLPKIVQETAVNLNKNLAKQDPLQLSPYRNRKMKMMRIGDKDKSNTNQIGDVFKNNGKVQGKPKVIVKLYDQSSSEEDDN